MPTEPIDTYFTSLKTCLDSLDRQEIKTFLHLLAEVREEERGIYIMGNGGSAATASHFVCDFNKGATIHGRQKPFRFVCLNDNVPTMLAYANDMAFEDIFICQLRNYMLPGDLVIGISGSGNSENVVRALAWANERGGRTVALVGFDGGRLKTIANHCVHVRAHDMQLVEDVHMILDHLCMRIIGEAQ